MAVLKALTRAERRNIGVWKAVRKLVYFIPFFIFFVQFFKFFLDINFHTFFNRLRAFIHFEKANGLAPLFVQTILSVLLLQQDDDVKFLLF